MTAPAPATVALVHGHRLDWGGVEGHLLSLLRHADRARFRHLLLAPASPGFAAEAEACGAQVVHWQPRGAFDLPAALALGASIRREGVQLVHTHDVRATLLARVGARHRAPPSVATVQMSAASPLAGGAAGWLRHRLYAAAERWLYRRYPDRVIFASARVADEALRRGVVSPARSLVIANGIELERHAGLDAERLRVRAELDTAPDAVVVICAARLEPQKDIPNLLAAARRLGAPGGVSYWIAGDGSQRARLERSAQDASLPVRFLGLRRDVPRLLAAADVFVLPSREEGLPLALLEAMSAGLPCVVSDVGECGPLVKAGGCGFSVPRCDPDALAGALGQLVADAQLRTALGAAARASAEGHDARATTQRVEAVYDALLAASPPSD